MARSCHLPERPTRGCFRTVQSEPAICDHPSENTPPNNIEVFTQTFSEQYISFGQRNVDGDRLVAEHRPQVSSSTTATKLFDILQAMIGPLSDLHTYITALALKKSTKEFWRPRTDRIIEGGVDDFAHRGRWRLFAMIDRLYLQRAPRMFCNRHLQSRSVLRCAGPSSPERVDLWFAKCRIPHCSREGS